MRLKLVDKIGKVDGGGGFFAQRNIEIAGVHQFTQGLMNSREEVSQVLVRIGALRDLIEGGLKLFRLLALGNIEGGGDNGALALKNNGAGAKIHPPGFAGLVDNA